MIQTNSEKTIVANAKRGCWTLGGKQFWTDWRWADQWRVQRFCYGQRARLIDPQNRLVKSGSFEDCQLQLDEMIAAREIDNPQRPVVILLHGLCRTRTSFGRLERALASRTSLTPIRISYSSTRQTLGQSAIALRHLIDRLGNVPQVHFVGHSMGNILVRRLFHDLQRARQTIQRGRMVMLAPPNQGSAMARWLKFSLLFNSIAGVGGREFSWNWDEVSRTLAIPDREFGVVAGAQQRFNWASNPLLGGTDDWTVRTSETRLDGETDRLEGSFFHGSIMINRQVIDATIQFLETGTFDSKNAPIASHLGVKN